MVDLATLVASRFGLLVTDSQDESRIRALLVDVAQRFGIPLWTWSASRGLAVTGGSAQHGTLDIGAALAFVRDVANPGIFAFFDAGPILDTPAATRLAKELAALPADMPAPGRTIILTGLGPAVPAGLRPQALFWSPPAPSQQENRTLVEHVLAGLAASGFRVNLPEPVRARLAMELAGLTRVQAQQLLVAQAVDDGALAESDLPALRAAKAALMAADSPLDLIAATTTLDDVGGLDNLKSWLRERGRGFEPAARRFGLEPPRGVLLTGVPGTGKSLVARGIAGTWGMALVALDTGRIHGSLVGESEQRLRSALQAAEAMAPVVLWIDEVEKAFRSGTDNDSGVGSRTLGMLLRWLQERPEGIFIVATCNDIEAMPPELTRRGRFDEVFFVDLPAAGQRSAILAGHLARRGWDCSAFDLGAVAAATEGYSGAELEATVVGCLYASYAAGTQPDTAALLAEAAEVVPLSVLRAEDVAALRNWARGRATTA